MNKVETVKQIIDESGGHIASVVFVKMDGTVRKMNFRTQVSKGVNGKGLKYNPSSVGNTVVYDMGADGYRTIKLDNVQSLKVNGKSYNWSK
jgi:archaellum component FlaG (FlaF/FlaG flagellin family)